MNSDPVDKARNSTVSRRQSGLAGTGRNSLPHRSAALSRLHCSPAAEIRDRPTLSQPRHQHWASAAAAVGIDPEGKRAKELALAGALANAKARLWALVWALVWAVASSASSRSWSSRATTGHFHSQHSS